MRRIPLLILCVAGACQQHQPAVRADTPAVDPGAAGALVSANLAPLARFIGEWEGTLESLSGNYQLARRVSWLIEDSWLIERTAVRRDGLDDELHHSVVLYTYDVATRSLQAHDLQPEGRKLTGTIVLRDDGFTRELTPADPETPRSVIQTSLFNGRDWQGRAMRLDEEGLWQEVDRFKLSRKARPGS